MINIGDKVRIKTIEEFKKEYTEKYRIKIHESILKDYPSIYVVKKVNSNNTITIELDNGNCESLFKERFVKVSEKNNVWENGWLL